jgi:hypothetical protein
MRPAETLPNGTVLRFVPNGYRIGTTDHTAAKRIRVKLEHGTTWIARCDSWDGVTWSREWTVRRTLLQSVEMAVRHYAEEMDNQPYAHNQP